MGLSWAAAGALRTQCVICCEPSCHGSEGTLARPRERTHPPLAHRHY